MGIRRRAAMGAVAALLCMLAMAVSWGPGAQVASACDCNRPADDATATAAADVAFTGTLVERIDPDPLVTSADPVRYVFDVELIHKGQVGPRVEVESAWDSASCGAVIAADSPMFVVARNEEERLVTALCSGTRPITDVVGPPAIEGLPPDTSSTTEPEPSDADADADETASASARTSCDESAGDCVDQGGGSSVLILVAIAAALLAAGIAAGVWRVRRSAT